jgi:hypothetical protein
MNTEHVHTIDRDVDAENAETSRREVSKFISRPLPVGQSYLAYLVCDAAVPLIAERIGRYRITTWTGETLARVTAIKSRRNRRGYMTDTIGSFWARGIDGRVYYGTHNGAGMYCRMRVSKNQTLGKIK